MARAASLAAFFMGLLGTIGDVASLDERRKKKVVGLEPRVAQGRDQGERAPLCCG
ncbi:MAG TPA: hypothetical protein VMU18_13485 [Rhodoblastus sp.]|nr:hypothetical protein [Rhodoblastus sp.]